MMKFLINKLYFKFKEGTSIKDHHDVFVVN